MKFDRLRQQKLKALRYEADLAQRRYLQVDPHHSFGRRRAGG